MKWLSCEEDLPISGALSRSQRLLLIQGALASVLYALGTGNFLAGYLSALQVAPAQVAKIAAVPQLGCILQLIAPLYFERKARRKRSIVALCFIYRFGIGAMALAALLFSRQSQRFSFVFVLYIVSFLSAGFVTPALNQWIMQIAPTRNRGRYFAAKDIIAAVANAMVAFFMGRWVDTCIAAGTPLKGYLLVYGFCMLAALVDAALLGLQVEIPSPVQPNIRPGNLLAPLRDKHFRPLMVYEILGICSYMVSAGFLPVYQLNVLQLSHTFLTLVGMITSAAGMAAIWFWGRIADRTYWTTVILATRAMNVLCMFGWWLMPPESARIFAPILMTLSAVGPGAASMADVNLQYAHCPSQGKTVYLGVTTALGSLAGYGAALLGSAVQAELELFIGTESSMAAVFSLSGIISLATFLYGRKHLPRRDY